MEVSRDRVRRTAAAAGTVIVLYGAGSVAPAFAGDNQPATSSNPTLLNDAHHFRAPRNAITSRAPVIVRVDGGFDWIDAAVGAVAGFGLTLVVSGAIPDRRRRWPDHAVVDSND